MKHLFYLFVLNLIIFNSFLKCYQSETDPKSGKVFPVSFYIIKDIETSAALPKAIPGTLQFAKGSSIFTVNSKKSMPAKMGYFLFVEGELLFSQSEAAMKAIEASPLKQFYTTVIPRYAQLVDFLPNFDKLCTTTFRSYLKDKTFPGAGFGYEVIVFCLPDRSSEEDINKFRFSFIKNYINFIEDDKNLLDVQRLEFNVPIQLQYFEPNYDINAAENNIPESFASFTEKGVLFGSSKNFIIDSPTFLMLKEKSKKNPEEITSSFRYEQIIDITGAPAKLVTDVVDKKIKGLLKPDNCCIAWELEWQANPTSVLLCSLQSNPDKCSIEIKIFQASLFRYAFEYHLERSLAMIKNLGQDFDKCSLYPFLDKVKILNTLELLKRYDILKYLDPNSELAKNLIDMKDQLDKVFDALSASVKKDKEEKHSNTIKIPESDSIFSLTDDGSESLREKLSNNVIKKLNKDIDKLVNSKGKINNDKNNHQKNNNKVNNDEKIRALALVINNVKKCIKSKTNGSKIDKEEYPKYIFTLVEKYTDIMDKLSTLDKLDFNLIEKLKKGSLDDAYKELKRILQDNEIEFGIHGKKNKSNKETAIKEGNVKNLKPNSKTSKDGSQDNSKNLLDSQGNLNNLSEFSVSDDNNYILSNEDGFDDVFANCDKTSNSLQTITSPKGSGFTQGKSNSLFQGVGSKGKEQKYGDSGLDTGIAGNQERNVLGYQEDLNEYGQEYNMQLNNSGVNGQGPYRGTGNLSQIGLTNGSSQGSQGKNGQTSSFGNGNSLGSNETNGLGQNKLNGQVEDQNGINGLNNLKDNNQLNGTDSLNQGGQNETRPNGNSNPNDLNSQQQNSSGTGGTGNSNINKNKTGNSTSQASEVLTEEEKEKLKNIPAESLDIGNLSEDQKKKLASLSNDELNALGKLSDEQKKNLLNLTNEELEKYKSLNDKEKEEFLSKSKEERLLSLMPQEEKEKFNNLSDSNKELATSLSNEQREALYELSEENKKLLDKIENPEEKKAFLSMSDKEKEDFSKMSEEDQKKFLENKLKENSPDQNPNSNKQQNQQQELNQLDSQIEKLKQDLSSSNPEEKAQLEQQIKDLETAKENVSNEVNKPMKVKLVVLYLSKAKEGNINDPPTEEGQAHIQVIKTPSVVTQFSQGYKAINNNTQDDQNKDEWFEEITKIETVDFKTKFEETLKNFKKSMDDRFYSL